MIAEHLQSDRILSQKNIYLRDTRPAGTGVTEDIGWHRASFCGPSMDQSVNFWVPILNVTAENVSEDDASVECFSAGHRISLLYAPKQITQGVDLATSKPFCVLPGETMIFAGHLIHGAADNRSDKIQFSMDFRLIAEESLATTKEHFAFGRSRFQPL